MAIDRIPQDQLAPREDYLPFIREHLSGWSQGQLIKAVNSYIRTANKHQQGNTDYFFNEEGVCSAISNCSIFFLTRAWHLQKLQEQQIIESNDKPLSMDYSLLAAFKKSALAAPRDINLIAQVSFEQLLSLLPDARQHDPKLEATYQQLMAKTADITRVAKSSDLQNLQYMQLLSSQEIRHLLSLKKDMEEVINLVNSSEKRYLFYPPIMQKVTGITLDTYELINLETLNYCEVDEQDRNLLFWIIERNDLRFIPLLAEYPIDWLDFDEGKLSRLKKIENEKRASCWSLTIGQLWNTNNHLLSAYTAWQEFLSDGENLHFTLDIKRNTLIKQINLYDLIWSVNQICQKDAAQLTSEDINNLTNYIEDLNLIGQQHSETLQKLNQMNRFISVFQQLISARLTHIQHINFERNLLSGV